MFTNLSYLNFDASSTYFQKISFNRLAQQTIVSSNLLKLSVYSETSNDCLHLLDSRFEKLHTLFVNISSICSDQTIDNKVS
jgi:hypothetical protein